MQSHRDTDVTTSLLDSLPLTHHGPILPPELERHIFEQAISMNPQCAIPLVLVARRIKEWIEPLLYDILVFASKKSQSYPPIYEGRDRLKVVKTPQFDKAMKHARHILIQGAAPVNTLEILEHCTDVRNLALWGLPLIEEDKHSILLPLLRSLPNLEYLSASPLDIFDSQFRFDHTSFMNITHLQMLAMKRGYCEWSQWRNMALLPKLTHLSIDYSTPEFVRDIIEGCPNLKILVAFYEERKEILDRIRTCGCEWIPSARHPDVGVMLDNRVVQLHSSTEGWIEDWTRRARGEEDFWYRAEEQQELQLARSLSSLSLQDSFTHRIMHVSN